MSVTRDRAIIRHVTDNTKAGSAPESFDALVADLQALRIESGAITYDELAAQITRNRLSRGDSPAAARVARSTVYDAFRTGRRRINAELVAEIVTALGSDEAASSEWRRRCLRAGLSSMPARTQPAVVLEDVRLSSSGAIIAIVMLASLGLNLFGNATSARMSAPLFLDMIGTAIASIAFGPWYGAAVGLSTNVLASLSNSPQALPFAAVNIVGALVWGYGVRAWGLGRTPLRFFSLNVIAAVACTLTAVPILALAFDGTTVNDAAKGVFAVVQTYGISLWEALFASNIVVSVADKMIAGFVAAAVTIMLLKQPAVGLAVRRRPVLWNEPAALATARRRKAPAPTP